MENKLTLFFGVPLVISILCIAGVVSVVGITWEHVMWGAIVGVIVTVIGFVMNYIEDLRGVE